MTYFKRFGASLLICIALLASVTPVQGATLSATQKALANLYKKKAIKKGWKEFKYKNKYYWVYYNKKKPVTGLKTISGKKYDFDAVGTMLTGKQTIKGKIYYFNQSKKRAKAPMLKNASKKVGKTTYYFSSKGYGFLSVGNTNGNKAFAMIMDAVNIKTTQSKKAQLKTVYQYINKKMTYSAFADSPKLSNASWMYNTALATLKDADDDGTIYGKCYNYAALNYVAAKALGYKVTAVVGTSNMYRKPDVYTEHAYVLITNGTKTYVLDGVYDDSYNSTAAKMKALGITTSAPYFFMNTYQEADEGLYQMAIAQTKAVDDTVSACDITNYTYKEEKRYTK